MDDIRRPQRPQRRDYALPSARPPAPRPHPAPHQPSHPHQPTHQPAQPAHHYTQPPAYTPQPVQPHTPAHHATQPAHHQAAHPVKTSKKFGKKITIAFGVVLAAAAVFGAGWLLKGTSPQTTIPSSITRQVNYSLFFPSPMPAGYTYMKDTATFQIGQVYYKFSNGKKRVTVNEQPKPETPPDLNKLTGYMQFDSPAGKAAVGVNLGEPAAIVITPTTVITMNTVGGVTSDELRTAITNLKNIGQRNQPANG